MPYKLKVTGQKELKSSLKEVKNNIKAALKELDGESAELTIAGIDVTFEVKRNDLVDLNKKLSKAMKIAHEAALKQIALDLEQALNEAMESPVWDWGSDTRDIVDTGALKNSLKIYVDSDSDIHILYGEDYAGIVHYGGYFNPYGNKTIKEYYPGRPWVSSVLNGGGPVSQYDFEGSYKALLSLELSRLIR